MLSKKTVCKKFCVTSYLQVRVISGILIAFVSSLFAIGLILFMAWQAFIQNEKERIDSLAKLLIRRADFSFFQATHVLKNISMLQITPCSPEHIIHMQQIMFKTAPIDKMAYFQHGAIECSSHGEINQLDPSSPIQYQIDFVTPDGIEVITKVPLSFSEENSAMLLKYGSYGVFINTNRFVDIIVENNVKLILATFDGIVIAINTPSMDDFLHKIIMNRNNAQSPRHLYSVEKESYWIAAATKPKMSIFKYLRREYKIICPITFVIGIFIFILMLRLALRRPSIQWELRQALKNKEFKVYYQPIINSQTKCCSGAEALLRWRRPDGLMIRPDVFIPLAEENGFIKPITDQLIETVIQDMREILAANPELHISINISTKDVKAERLSAISNAFANAGIKPEKIWLEVSERGFMDIDLARICLTEVRKQGYIVAIDDFGTGHSNLQYLHNLPIDVLKIDKIFVDSIETGSASSNVISHIIDMAKSLKLTLVAEGVETQNQADYLTACGVDFMQGWFYFKALTVKEFLNIVIKMDIGLQTKI